MKNLILLPLLGLTLFATDYRWTIPHFTVKDGQWQTEITLINQGFFPLTLQLNAYSESGEVAGQSSIKIDAGNTVVGQVDELIELSETQGWIEIVSNRAEFTGGMTFLNLLNGGEISVPFQKEAHRFVTLPTLRESDEVQSGLVILNPNDLYTSMTITLVDNTTHERFLLVEALEPQSKVTLMVQDLFEPPPGQYHLDIKSSHPIHAFGLQFKANQIISVPAQKQEIANIQASMQRDLDALMQHFQGGLSLSYSQNSTMYHASSGLASIENEEPMTANHASAIGSITKVFTATLVMQMVDSGHLSLDQNLSNWFPSSPLADQITLEMLLNHSSGIPDFINDRFIATLLSDPGQVWDPEHMLSFAYDEPHMFTPGSDYEYSNTNFLLLGIILQKESGQTYANLLRTRIFEPLDLTQTYVRGYETPVEIHAQGYILDPDQELGLGPIINSNLAIHGSSSFAEGGIVSTPRDLITFLEGLLDGELISEQSLAKMLAPSENNPTYGLGITINDDGLPDEASLGHDGAFVWGVANLAHFPEIDTTVSLVYNVFGVSFDSLIQMNYLMQSSMTIAKVHAYAAL